MLVLVTGGSGSGKSAFAEKKLLSFKGERRYYVATMRCYDDESERRVARHRKMRTGKGFCTVERPLDLAGMGELPREGSERVDVLLECMSNLAANEMFDPEGSGERAFSIIQSGIDSLLKQCDNLVVVTNEIFSDGITYDPATEAYMRLLGRLNTAIARQADEVFEVVCGIPLTVKAVPDHG